MQADPNPTTPPTPSAASPAESSSQRPDLPLSSLAPFLLLAFVIAWGVLALFIGLPDQMERLVGPLTGNHPLFFLAVWAPAIAAFIVVLYHQGLGGLKRFLARMLLWRCGAAWYVFLLVGVPLIFVAGAALKGTLLTDPLPFANVQGALVALGLAAIKGPVEEFGWRGLALPLLQRRLAPFWASLILGAIWGLWHLPAFLLGGTQQSEWAFAPFFLGCIGLSVIVTPLFNASGGSILLTALFHFVLMNPLLPDAQPYDNYIVVAVAGVIVWLNRKSMFTRLSAVTEVVPGRRPMP